MQLKETVHFQRAKSCQHEEDTKEKTAPNVCKSEKYICKDTLKTEEEVIGEDFGEKK